ncbi:MAG: 2-phospho-L-lactate transferase [Acidimicrobiia bacterium]|nr:2-phospho-L-lactate transferase [Acidimicrobiia bacterium]
MKVVQLSGGVGGARLARGLDRAADVDLTVIVNVGDDDVIHGMYVSADLDTVLYTLAGLEGTQGWGRAGDSFATNEELGRLGADNQFQLGDRDLALNILRTAALASGEDLASFTGRIAKQLDIGATILPATNDYLRTRIRNAAGETMSFQEYFVIRQNREEVSAVEYAGAPATQPGPGVIESINDADLVVIGPSNPPLSIWPILAIPGIRDAIGAHRNVAAVSPLFGGKAIKGPAHRVMASLGLPAGNAGVAAAYEGLLQRLIVDQGDRGDTASITGLEVTAADTRIPDGTSAQRFVEEVLLR